MQTKFDVIIVGGGLVGVVLACLLGKEGFAVALVERNTLQTITLSQETYQLRVSAISPVCKIIFEQLNIWTKMISSGRVSPFEQIYVWDSLGKGEINFDCTKIAQPCLGYIIENAVMQNALLSELEQHKNVSVITGKTPESFSQSSDGLALKLPDLTLTAKLIVGADGPHSWVRTRANIGVTSWPYDHEALVTTVQTELSHQKTAWQSFLPDGPLALLPLVDEHTCSIVWSSDPLEIKRLQQMSDRQFNQEISSAFDYRLGGMKKISTELTVPLLMRHAKEYVKPRLALIGDAAHTIHPLAGQGINLGFLDAQALAKNIIKSRHNGQDWGEYIHLRDYERQRKSENWLMILGMDVFKRLFQSESFLTVNARSTGLKFVDKIDFLKNQFIYHATGLR